MQERVVAMANTAIGTVNRYNGGARLLHWLIALLMAGMYLTDQVRDFYDRGTPERDWWLGAHASMGIVVLGLTILRLLWRLVSKSPEALPASPLVQLGAKLGHLVLYLATFGLPLSGFLRYASTGRDVMLYGNTLASPFGNNEMLHNIGEFLHNGLWTNLLLFVIGIHVAAALYHHFILKDGTLRRMA
jgi:cytochrome b561